MLFLILPLLSTLVLSKPIVQSIQSLALHASLGEIRSKAQNPSICLDGERTLIVDAEKRLQTLQWNIGAIEAVQTPVECETTMSMDYNPQWQYAVTEINWHSYANLLSGSSATAGLSYGFGPVAPVLPVTLNWLINGPFDSIWDQKFPIPVASQEWTACGAVSPLTFQWSIKINPNTKSLSSLYMSPGQLGKATSAGGNLTLGIVTKFRECVAGAKPIQPVAPVILPTPIQAAGSRPTDEDSQYRVSGWN